MDKKANLGAASIFVPGIGFTDSLNTSQLPRLSQHRNTNDLLWATLGNTVSMGGAGVLAAYILNKINQRKWDAKSREATKNKINVIHPISTPNYDQDDEEENETIREVGMDKNASILNWITQSPTVQKGLVGAIPITAGLGAMAIAKSVTDDAMTDRRKEDLDEQIQQERNKLDALHAKLLDMYRGNVPKTAAATPREMRAAERSLQAAENNPSAPGNTNLLTDVTGILTASALATGAIATYAALRYFNKTDPARKKLKVMQDVAAMNSTNIPPALTLQLNDVGLPPSAKQKRAETAELLSDEHTAPKQLAAPKDDFLSTAAKYNAPAYHL